jgi:hypothetical protein
MIPDEYLSLEIAECVDGCSIAGEDHDISSSSIESLYSLLGQISDLISVTMTIGSILSIHLEDHLDMWIFTSECVHHDLSAESGIEKSEKHN